jgi:aminomethyltransferase
MAYLPPALATPGTALEIDIRGKRYPAEALEKPFYKKPWEHRRPAGCPTRC